MLVRLCGRKSSSVRVRWQDDVARAGDVHEDPVHARPRSKQRFVRTPTAARCVTSPSMLRATDEEQRAQGNRRCRS